MIWTVFKKSVREQWRNFWILLLTVLLAPFFVFIYYLINEASQPRYDILFLNQDRGIETADGIINHGKHLIEYFGHAVSENSEFHLKLKTADNRIEAENRLITGKSDILVVLPENFSATIQEMIDGTEEAVPDIEFVGDLTNIMYMVSAVWTHEIISSFVLTISSRSPVLTVYETALGNSGQVDEFDTWMPGILILAVIMLMFSATIAIVTEVEQQTILRLKLSNLNAFQFLSGISLSQIIVGILSIGLTLMVAMAFGFDIHGSWGLFFLIAVLTSLSIIAFSLLLAAFTKTVTEVLIVGNFPLFLFMFFTGAAFPMQGKTIFTIAGYAITWQGFMSPTHAIQALSKVTIMGMGLRDVFPELVAIIVLICIYSGLGVWAFQQRHLRTE